MFWEINNSVMEFTQKLREMRSYKCILGHSNANMNSWTQKKVNRTVQEYKSIIKEINNGLYMTMVMRMG